MRINMRIGTRILAGYGLAVLLMAGMGVVAYRSTGELVDGADWVTHTYKVKDQITKTLATLTNAETAQRGYLLTGEERYLEPYRVAGRDFNQDIETLHELTADNSSQQRRIMALQSVVTERLKRLAAAIDLKNSGARSGDLTADLDEGKTAMDEALRIGNEMDAEENGLLAERDRKAKDTAAFSQSAIIWGGLVILISVSTVGVLIHRSIARPLSAFMRFVDQVGRGDLTQKSNISSRDELGELGQSLDRMVAGLREVASQTLAATGNLTSASTEILASTQQQAASTGEQAAAVQQTTVTMEEVTQSGNQITERAKQVAVAAEAVSSASHSGLQAVQNTGKTMENIREQAEAVAENVVSLSEKTQAIGEIIATVNDLAEQSHLLALNAAIEAAAAGEHGRSFSVIASEVKNLADQSREATVQVRAILGDIQKGINGSVMLTEEAVKRVESGRQQAEVADRTIRTMTENIQESVRAFQQIVAGSNQQQIGFTQVMQAVRDIGQASQQTAASTSQLERAALNLTALGQQLQKAVEKYRM
jgi:methyl-accepting chemotaxis protein